MLWLGTFTILVMQYLMLYLGTFTILPVMQHLMLWLGTFTILPVMQHLMLCVRYIYHSSCIATSNVMVR